MGSVLGWPPVVWAMRVALLVVLAGCSYLYLLLIVPFFRPAHVRRLVRADLPRVLRIGAEIAGTRGEVHFVQDQPVPGAVRRAGEGVAARANTGLREGDDDAIRGREAER